MIPAIQELTPIEKWMRNTGYLLRKARLLRKLSQQEAALRSGLHEKLLCKIETGHHLGNILTYRKIADAYGISYGFLSAVYHQIPTGRQWHELELLQKQQQANRKSRQRIKLRLYKQLELNW